MTPLHPKRPQTSIKAAAIGGAVIGVTVGLWLWIVEAPGPDKLASVLKAGAAAFVYLLAVNLLTWAWTSLVKWQGLGAHGFAGAVLGAVTLPAVVLFAATHICRVDDRCSFGAGALFFFIVAGTGLGLVSSIITWLIRRPDRAEPA